MSAFGGRIKIAAFGVRLVQVALEGAVALRVLVGTLGLLTSASVSPLELTLCRKDSPAAELGIAHSSVYAFRAAFPGLFASIPMDVPLNPLLRARLGWEGSCQRDILAPRDANWDGSGPLRCKTELGSLPKAAACQSPCGSPWGRSETAGTALSPELHLLPPLPLPARLGAPRRLRGVGAPSERRCRPNSSGRCVRDGAEAVRGANGVGGGTAERAGLGAALSEGPRAGGRLRAGGGAAPSRCIETRAAFPPPITKAGVFGAAWKPGCGHPRLWIRARLQPTCAADVGAERFGMDFGGAERGGDAAFAARSRDGSALQKCRGFINEALIIIIIFSWSVSLGFGALERAQQLSANSTAVLWGRSRAAFSSPRLPSGCRDAFIAAKLRLPPPRSGGGGTWS